MKTVRRPAARLGVLAASALSALIGWAGIRAQRRASAAAPAEES